MLRTHRETLRAQQKDLTSIKEEIDQAVAKRRSLQGKAKREKMKCEREFLRRQNLGFTRVFKQFETEFFGLGCGAVKFED